MPCLFMTSSTRQRQTDNSKNFLFDLNNRNNYYVKRTTDKETETVATLVHWQYESTNDRKRQSFR